MKKGKNPKKLEDGERQGDSLSKEGVKKEDSNPAQEKMVTIPVEEYNSLRETEAKSQEYFRQLVRLKADYENAFKQFERRREEYISLANFSLIREMLSILDDLERLLKSADSPQDRHLLQGCHMIYKNFVRILKSQGLREIEAKEKVFDPFLHEAVSWVCFDDKPEGLIVEEVQKGYMLGNKVLRSSKVIVNKHQAKNNDSQDSQQKEG